MKNSYTLLSVNPCAYMLVMLIISLMFIITNVGYARVNTLESKTVDGSGANNSSFNPSLSYDGTYTLFESLATNLIGGKAGTFLYNASADTNKLSFMGSFSNVTINGGGDIVTFTEASGGVVRIGQFQRAGGVTNYYNIGYAPDVLESPSCNSNAMYVTCAAKPSSGWADHIYMRDITLGTNILVSKPLSGDRLLVTSDKPAVDASGDHVVFRSSSTNLVAGVNPAGIKQIFLWTRTTKAITLISKTSGSGPVNSDCGPPVISGDGRWISFSTAASDVMSGDVNNYWDIFLYDNLSDQFYRASSPTGGGWAAGSGTGAAAGLYAPSIAYDGSALLFSTEANNLVADDANNSVDLYLYKYASGDLELISANSDDQVGDASTSYGVLDMNAEYVAMVSEASNIAGANTNDISKVYFQNIDAVEINLMAQGSATLSSPAGVSSGGGAGAGGSVNMRVHAVLRNLTLQHRLFYCRSAGPPIDITLYYNSGSDKAGQFGKKWSLGCNHTVVPVAGVPKVVLGDGREIEFEMPDSTPDSYEMVAPAGIKDRLSVSMDPWATDTVYNYLEYDRQYLYEFVGWGVLGMGDLWSVSDAHTNTIYYGPDWNYDHRLGYIQNGDYVTLVDFSNNSEGLCTQIRFLDRNGDYSRSVSFTYQNGCLKTVTDMAGNVVTMTYDNDGYMLSRSSGTRWMNFIYESQGFGASKLMSSVEDNNGVTTYASGGSLQTPAGRSLSVEANDRGQVISITRGGGTTKLSYDRYRVSSVKDSNNHTTSYDWNNDLNMTGFHDARGNSGSMTYQALPQSFSMPVTNSHFQPQTITLKDGGLISMTHTDAGKPKTLTTPAGDQFTIHYGTNGLFMSIDEAGAPLYTYTYDSMGNPLTMQDAQSNTTTFVLDDYWRCIRIIDSRGKSKKIDYDATDRPTKITYETVTGVPSLTLGYDVFDMTSITDERGKVSRVVRDPHANVRTRTPPEDNVSIFMYDADDNKTVVIDPEGRLTQMIYDGDSQMIQLVDALGNSVYRVYDPAGNVTSIKDQRGNVTTFEYDEENNVTTIQNAMGNTHKYFYDEEGRMVAKVNARGQTITNTVDTSGRITKHAATGLTDVTQTYDAHGNRLTRTDVTGTETYTYDLLHRLATVTYPDGKIVSYSYDSVGNITKIMYPSSFEVNYTYDDFCRVPVPNLYISKVIGQIGIPPEKKNRVVAMDWSGYQTLSCTFDAAANLLTETRNGSMVTTYTYDSNARRISIDHNAGATSRVNVVMSYDGADNIITRTVTGPAEPSLLYAEVRAEYNKLNSITEWNGAIVTNDFDGNILQCGSSFTAQYDVENHLTRYEAAGTTNIFTYNGDGYIATASINGDMRKFYYSPYGKLLFETDGVGAITKYYIYRENILVAQSDALASNHRHFYTDINGNVLLVTDNSGTMLEENSYTPYSWNSASGALANQPFRFAGALGGYDLGNDLVLMKRRIYNMRFGRFMQPDPKGYSEGSHLFLYANANPLRNVDPEGTFSFKKVSDWVYGGYTGSEAKREIASSRFKAAVQDSENRDNAANYGSLDDRIEAMYDDRDGGRLYNAGQVLRDGFNAGKSGIINAIDSGIEITGVAGKVVSQGLSILDGATDLDTDQLMIYDGGAGNRSVYGGTPDSGGMSQSAGRLQHEEIDWSSVRDPSMSDD